MNNLIFGMDILLISTKNQKIIHLKARIEVIQEIEVILHQKVVMFLLLKEIISVEEEVIEMVIVSKEEEKDILE